jgi:hypothetical protein
LPDIYQGKLIYLTKVGNQTQVGYGWPYMPSSSIVGQNINPTDAAIELKVWLKGENNGHENKGKSNEEVDPKVL